MNLKGLKTLVLFLLAFSALASAQSHFSYAGTSNNMTVIFTNAPTLNGFPLAPGDEVGAFKSDGTTCVGAMVWVADPSQWAISVQGLDTTPPLPGMATGETVRWKVWQASTNTEAEGTPSFTLGDGIYAVNDFEVMSSLTATAAVNYTLTMAVSPGGSGTTTPAVGAHSYSPGSSVNITATPAAGYQFVNWTVSAGSAVAAPTSASTTVSMDVAKTVTANFALAPLTLTMAVSPGGSGTTTPAVGAHSYSPGSSVNITATPAAGYQFVNWTVSAGSAVAAPTSASTTVSMDVAKTVTANFALAPLTLTMAVSPGGSGTTTPAVGAHSYSPGSSVNITATPAAGYQFVNWTVSAGSAVAAPTSASTTVSMDVAKTVTANFALIPFALTMAVSPGGSGTTTPAVGAHSYSPGSSVNITATPAAGYQFVNWTVSAGSAVAAPTSASTTVSMDVAKTVTANFALAPLTLTMAVSPGGSGTTTPAVGAHSYSPGSSVNITATPAAGYQFVNWTVSAGSAVAAPTSASTTVSMDVAKTVTANFALAPLTLTMAVSPGGSGTTTPAVGAHSYAPNAVVNIVATPAAGYQFVNWTVSAGSAVAAPTSASTTVSMDVAKTVTANFALAPLTLTMAVSPGGSGTTTPAVGAHSYAPNAVVNIVATPAAGYQFVNWTVSAGSAVAAPTSASTTVTVDVAKTVTANFQLIPNTLTMAVSPGGSGTTTPAVGAHSYAPNAVVNIVATPAAGYQFVNWTVSAGSAVAAPTSASTTVTVDVAKTVTANFQLIPNTLTMAVSPGGSGTTTPAVGAHSYAPNAVVNIVATPAAGYQFVNWTVSAGSAVAAPTSASTTVTVDVAKTVTANFQLIPNTLTMAVSPGGSGTTTPAVGAHSYAPNAVVNIVATPAAGYQFVNWTVSAGSAVAAPTSASTTVTVDVAKTVTANFQLIPNTLTMAVSPGGSGTTTPAVGAHSYAPNAVVNIVATPAAGYQFVNWTVSAGSAVAAPTSASTTVTVDVAKTVTANFQLIPNTLTMAVSPGGSGTTTPAVGAHSYAPNAVVNIVATSAAGYQFVNWTVSAGSAVAAPTSASTTVTVDVAKTVTANFTQITYTLTAGNDGHGTVTRNPAGPAYAAGTTVTLTPVPASGYQFGSWSGANAGDIVNTGGVYTIVMNGNKVVMANFIEAEYTPVVEFWATPTRGYPALSVKFTDASEGYPYAWLWDFGDGQTSTEQNPTHVYWQPGKYSVTLTITTQMGVFSLEKEEFIYVCGFEFCSCVLLDLFDNGPSFASENWNNAIDRDASGLDGTVSAGGSLPYAIFRFHDNKSKQINMIRLMTNTDVGMEERWTKNFEVYISNTGLNDADFKLLLRGTKKGGAWEEFTCAPTQAKYIKLVLTNPNSGWRQLGEFEVCVVKEYPDLVKSSVKATSPHTANGVDASKMTITLKKPDGSALTGLSTEEFYLYSYSGAFTHTAVVESSTPGVYTTSITTIEPDVKEVKVIVSCKLVGSATINFSAPVTKESALVFIEGSTAFRNEGWDNLVDGDEAGWDGTATVGGVEPYAIFAFADNTVKAVQKISLLMNTGVGFDSRWVERFRLQASTSGKSGSDFVTVYDGRAAGGDWQDFTFPAFNAKYIKLIVDFPAGTWRQLGEMRVYTTTIAALAKQAGELVQIGDTPREWAVSNNYPNPFNPETRLQFSMPEAGQVTAAVFNMLGQRVRTLVNRKLPAGTSQVVWDSRSDAGETVPSGIYYVRFDLGGHYFTKKLVLTR